MGLIFTTASFRLRLPRTFRARFEPSANRNGEDVERIDIPGFASCGPNCRLFAERRLVPLRVLFCGSVFGAEWHRVRLSLAWSGVICYAFHPSAKCPIMPKTSDFDR